jgi:single-stranded-DNA-specific exonuclease
VIVECQIIPSEISFETLALIDRFRPFGIGNPKPKFYLENLTISDVQIIGAGKNHLSLSFIELPKIKCLLWNFQGIINVEPQVGDVITPVFSISKNVWKERESIQIIIDTFIKMENESENVNCEEYVKDL